MPLMSQAWCCSYIRRRSIERPEARNLSIVNAWFGADPSTVAIKDERTVNISLVAKGRFTSCSKAAEPDATDAVDLFDIAHDILLYLARALLLVKKREIIQSLPVDSLREALPYMVGKCQGRMGLRSLEMAMLQRR